MKNSVEEYLQASLIGQLSRGECVLINEPHKSKLDGIRSDLNRVLSLAFPLDHSTAFGDGSCYGRSHINSEHWATGNHYKTCTGKDQAPLSDFVEVLNVAQLIRENKLLDSLRNESIGISHDGDEKRVGQLRKVLSKALKTDPDHRTLNWFQGDTDTYKISCGAVSTYNSVCRVPLVPLEYFLAEIDGTEEQEEENHELVVGDMYYVDDRSEKWAMEDRVALEFMTNYRGFNYFLEYGSKPKDIIKLARFKYAVKATTEEQRFTSSDFVNALNSIEIDPKDGTTKIRGAFCAGYWIPFLDITPS